MSVCRWHEIQPNTICLLLRTVIFTSHGHRFPSAVWWSWFLCISNAIWISRSLCPHLCNRIFPFSPRHPFAPAAANITRDVPDWRVTDRWWTGARARRRKVVRAFASSGSLAVFLSFSPVCLFHPLSRCLWSRLPGAGAVTSPHSQQPSSQPSRRRWDGFHGHGVSGWSVRGGSQLINLAGPNRGIVLFFFGGGLVHSIWPAFTTVLFIYFLIVEAEAAY